MTEKQTTKTKKEELKELLENIPRSYYEFIDETMRGCCTDELRQIMIEFINNSDNISTGKVIQFYCDNILHLPRIVE